MITEPGIYALDAADYHRDCCPQPSLSRSIAMKLVRESPLHAHYAHPRLGGGGSDEPTDAADAGSVVHKFVLGVGANVVPVRAVYDAKHELAGQPVRDFRTKAAQLEADAIRSAGGVPILPARLEELKDAAEALKYRMGQNPDCDPFFAPGRAEAVVIAEEDGFWFRCMIDKLPDDPTAPPYDLKMTELSARPDSWERRVRDLYAFQAAFYDRLLRMIGQKRPPMLFCVGELKAPHGVSVMAADPALRMIAEAEVERAIQTWKSCLAADRWPGYAPYTHWVQPSSWQLMQHEQAAMEEV